MIRVARQALAARDASEIERAIAAFARGTNGGMIVTASPFGAVHPDLIAALAARYRLPAVYQSFPKIISARIYDAGRTRLVW